MKTLLLKMPLIQVMEKKIEDKTNCLLFWAKKTLKSAQVDCIFQDFCKKESSRKQNTCNSVSEVQGS